MIDINLPSLLPSSLLALLGPQFVETLLDDIAASARAKWIRLAQQELNTSRREYIAGIQPVEGSGRERIISLVGTLPTMIELGATAWDMRNTLLQSGAKTNKAGQKYRSIPFRHKTAEMGRRYGPQGPSSMAFAAQGQMDKGQASALGKAIYKAAKRLGQGQRLGGTRTIIDMGRGKIRVPKLAPWHKTDIYAGMQRTTKQYATATQAQYSTFRTISEGNPTGWIHPGIQARNLHVQVEQHIQGIVTNAVQIAVKNALGDIT